jgi:hypothetical protein
MWFEILPSAMHTAVVPLDRQSAAREGIQFRSALKRPPPEAYNWTVNSPDIRAFVERDWAAVADSKVAYWGGRFREDWRITWDAAQALLVHARGVGVSPTDAERAVDLESHRALRARLDRAAHAFARR